MAGATPVTKDELLAHVGKLLDAQQALSADMAQVAQQAVADKAASAAGAAQQ